ncbi:glutamate dehydrogenase, partial [Candidatus Aerophobetes bacterium]
TVPDVDFLKNKKTLVDEFQHIIKQRARDEAMLLLRTFAETGDYLTDISERISEKINTYTYELLDYLETQELSHDESNPLMKCLLNYCPTFIRENYKEHILNNIPDTHQNAIIACYIASKMVYSKGIGWSPSIVDILPLVADDINIIDPSIDDDLSFDLD